MTAETALPVGIEDFETIRRENLYYIDKTGLIKGILKNRAYVNLFTRPRRFGKTLNMSMLKCFFRLGCDRTLFDGLAIAEEKELCDKYMGKFPVISISLKAAAGDNFEEARGMFCDIIGREAACFSFLAESGRLSETERQQYRKLIELNEKGVFSMADALLRSSLLILSQLLYKHFEQKAIILIDEYDVPLDQAYRAGYYDAMVKFVGGLFGQALKTNSSLYCAVLTGCLRVSKESIFTGLNNFKVYTVKDVRYHEYFGFTDEEVRRMLDYYGFMEKYDLIKEWYDGYQFGDADIYCPWDVINYCDDLRDGNTAVPQNYWVNTSSNDIIRNFVKKANPAARNEIEQLISGGSIQKEIHQELTYRDLDADLDHLWSILFMTGYLTKRGTEADGMTELLIPNKEIRWIFVQQIRKWFKEETLRDVGMLENFCLAFQKNDVTAIERGFNGYLQKTISIRDTNAPKGMKENFYHGLLLGLLGNMHGWTVRSNAESGEGYSDILIETASGETGIVIELKYAENAAFDAACETAMRQIKNREYEETLVRDGMKTIYRYGIACYKKRCKVIGEKR